MKPLFQKNFKILTPNTKYICSRCRVPHKVVGDTYVYIKETTPSIDNKPAYRVFWKCREGHVKQRGYTRPVNFNKILGEQQGVENFKSYEEEEAEEESLYQDMLLYAKLKSENRRRFY